MSKNIELKKKIAVLLLLSIVFKLSFMPFLVRGESMSPTLHNFDVGIGIRTSIKEVNRFDIVIVKHDKKFLVKRVIGLPGENIVCQGNRISVNGIILDDKYAGGWTSDFSCQLNNDEYFCLGDNRENSSDSRVYGPFNIKDIRAISISKGEIINESSRN